MAFSRLEVRSSRILIPLNRIDQKGKAKDPTGRESKNTEIPKKLKKLEDPSKILKTVN